MDGFSILGYINKFSLAAFVVTGLVLGYQIYQLKKDSGKKNDHPDIPDFSEGHSIPSLNYTKLETPDAPLVKKAPNMNLFFLIGVTVVVMLILFFALVLRNNSDSNSTPTPPLVKFVASKGIKIYDQKWLELNDQAISKLTEGEAILVAIEKTNDPNIDRARIRVNKSSWVDGDEKLAFDSTRNMYYKNYTLATEAAFLKVEAQLHSKVDGWLGE